jgi:hypothetical protein
MSAMQRALLARDAVREPERRLALPVVVAAMVLAVGVAIGIPLLSKRPTRVVDAEGAGATSATVSASSSLVAATTGPATGPSNTGFVGPLGPAPSGPGTLGLAPTGPVPGAPPPLPPTASAPVNPFALPDSNRTARTREHGGTASVSKPPRRRDPAPPRAPRPDRSERERPDDDDDEAPLPKEFEQPRERERPSASREPKEPTSSSPGGKGLLTVVCSPPCDEVLDGSKSLGASPVVKVPVSAGTHRLTLRISEPPMEKVVTVTVSPDETTFLTQPMTK